MTTNHSSPDDLDTILFEWDVFICHASEDKDAVVRPLAKALMEEGFSVWYDELSLELGDSLRQSIDEGLAQSRFGVVVLSPNFFAKKWTQVELNGLVTRETSGKGEKVILPVWHEVDLAFVASQSVMLADRVAGDTRDGMDKVMSRLLRVLRPQGTSPNRQTRCHIEVDQAVEMARTLADQIGVKYAAKTASDVEHILERAVRIVVNDYSLIPTIHSMLANFTVREDANGTGFVVEGGPDIVHFAEHLINGERPHIPDLD